MRRLILHIGPFKTGTSSFQHWLRGNAAVLADAGLVLPLDLLNPNANGEPLAHAFLAAPEDRTAEQSDLVDRFGQFCAAHPDASVILSAERLSRMLLVDGSFRNEFDPRESDSRRQRAARHLHDAVSTLGFDRIDLLVLIREQAGFLTSAYVQKLKTMNARLDLGARGLEAFPVQRYAESFRQLSDLGFHVIAAPYHSPDRALALPERLMAMAGFDGPLKGRVTCDVPRVNVSPGYLTTIGLGHVFWHLETLSPTPDAAEADQLRRRLFAITRAANVEGDGPLTLFAPDQAAAIAARQRRHLDGIEPWAQGLTAADIAGSFPAHRAQSPLSRNDLGTHERHRIDQWLRGIAAQVQRDNRLRQLIDPATLSDLDASPPGVHSAPQQTAPCLGGTWAAAAPDGRRPLRQAL
ncbi:hypothetical protein PVW51_19810 [Sulfitobacter sp. PR48]|uniref:hypothetical protein n=1 Tax=Sulfitobacter sp. PR48 TaxID=3028383 RepID=UPI00237C2606|nr:hypothetical protein [Sulfitobacter sp. PR48]MDD9722958.1 hypothetical protein [Sulfitobacter sp. PR48]